MKNSEAGENEVISTIMSRRSVRDYKPNAISRDTMQIIAECGINAPNAMNKRAMGAARSRQSGYDCVNDRGVFERESENGR